MIVKVIWTTIVSCHNRAYRFEVNASERICACNIIPNREPDHDGHIRLAPHWWLNWENPVQTYVIISEREIWSWQIVAPEMDQWWSCRIQAQQIVSEYNNPHHFVSKPKISKKSNDQLRMANRGIRNGSHDSGNAAYKSTGSVYAHFSSYLCGSTYMLKTQEKVIAYIYIDDTFSIKKRRCCWCLFLLFWVVSKIFTKTIMVGSLWKRLID